MNDINGLRHEYNAKTFISKNLFGWTQRDAVMTEVAEGKALIICVCVFLCVYGIVASRHHDYNRILNQDATVYINFINS